jgi:phosphatidylglycerophosphate synthase
MAGRGRKKNIDGKRIRVKRKLFTVANLISASRIVAVIPLILAYEAAGRTPDFQVMLWTAWIILSDYLDGLAARKLDEITEAGKIVDPIADKTCAGLLIAYTVWVGLVPFWFLVLLLARDLLILAGSLHIRYTRGKVAMSVMSGKIAVNVLTAYFIAVFFFPEAVLVHTYLKWLTTSFLIGSFGDYMYRYVKIRQGYEFN